MIRIFSDEHDRFLMEHYTSWGASRCAARFGVKPHAVSSRMSYLRKLGKTNAYVDPNVVCEILRRPKPPRPEKVKTDQFRTPNTPEIVYLLGLLWADGCVYIDERLNNYRLCINLVAEDFASVEAQFDAIGKWGKCRINKKTGRVQTSAYTNNRALCRFLESMGYRSKSGHPHILSIIPDELKPLWFRGLMDGDGCFYIAPKHNQASVCGPAEQDWAYLESTLKSLDINFKTRITGSAEKGGTRSTVNIKGLQGISRWGDYIYATYPTDRIGFPRKYEKFLQLKNRFAKSEWWHRHLLKSE